MDILNENLFVTLTMMCCGAVLVIQRPRIRRLTHQPEDDTPPADQAETQRIAEIERLYGPRAARACVSLEQLMAAYKRTDERTD